MNANIPRYIALARAIGSMNRCNAANNTEWSDKHANAILELMDSAPSGSGIDCGTKLADCSTGEQLVFDVSFHHMDEAGGYDGWTEHRIILRPSFELGYRMTITGKDRNGIKEYLSDTYSFWLSELVPQWTGYEQPSNSPVPVS